MHGEGIVKYFILTLIGIASIAKGYAVSEQGALNAQADGALFQNKCSACHTVGLVSWEQELLPTDIWNMVNRMANYQGANIFCCADRRHLYMYIVDYIAKNRAADLAKALKCLPEEYRQYEKEKIEAAQERYK